MRVKAKQRIIIGVVVLLLPALIMGKIILSESEGGEVVKTAISPDGKYVLTTDSKNFAILWNLENHTKKIVSRDANMYGAYWVEGTNDYVWQSLADKVVHVVDNATDKEIDRMSPGFIAYGQAVSSNLQNYVASDSDWNIYLYKNNERYQLAKMFTSGTFEGTNKIINFTFLKNDNLLASGMGYPTGDMQWGPTLWDLNTQTVLHKYIGNMVQTFATISPDGKYVVAGDANGGNLFVWDLKSGENKLHVVANLPVYGYTKEGKLITNVNLPKPPSDFYNYCDILSLKYIDHDHYLVFEHQSHHAILYQTLNSTLIKYVDLGTTPWPATFNLERDQSMDTSPSAHVLVMAKDQEPGIMVYHYDPTTQTLKKVWNGK